MKTIKIILFFITDATQNKMAKKLISENLCRFAQLRLLRGNDVFQFTSPADELIFVLELSDKRQSRNLVKKIIESLLCKIKVVAATVDVESEVEDGYSLPRGRTRRTVEVYLRIVLVGGLCSLSTPHRRRCTESSFSLALTRKAEPPISSPNSRTTENEHVNENHRRRQSRRPADLRSPGDSRNKSRVRLPGSGQAGVEAELAGVAGPAGAWPRGTERYREPHFLSPTLPLAFVLRRPPSCTRTFRSVRFTSSIIRPLTFYLCLKIYCIFYPAQWRRHFIFLQGDLRHDTKTLLFYVINVLF